MLTDVYNKDHETEKAKKILQLRLKSNTEVAKTMVLTEQKHGNNLFVSAVDKSSMPRCYMCDSSMKSTCLRRKYIIIIYIV